MRGQKSRVEKESVSGEESEREIMRGGGGLESVRGERKERGVKESGRCGKGRCEMRAGER